MNFKQVVEEEKKEAEIEWGLKIGPKSNQRDQNTILKQIVDQAMIKAAMAVVEEQLGMFHLRYLNNQHCESCDNEVEFCDCSRLELFEDVYKFLKQQLSQK